MKLFCIILALFMIAGCQSVQTEDGKMEHQLHPKITNTAHATVHALDIPIKAVCDFTERGFVSAGEMVGLESSEPVEKTVEQKNTNAWVRVLTTLLIILAA
jgi:uncharacterized protein YceK